MTLPPFQYSSGGLITRPLRDTVARDEEGGGQGSAGEEEKIKHYVLVQKPQYKYTSLHVLVLSIYLLGC